MEGAVLEITFDSGDQPTGTLADVDFIAFPVQGERQPVGYDDKTTHIIKIWISG
jgi:hypothetical protein